MSFSMKSLQRIDPVQRCLLPRQLPVRHQFGLVFLGPVNDKPLASSRQISFEKGDWIDPDYRLLLSIANMEMWRSVIVVIHRHHHAVESTDFWHGHSLGSCDRNNPAGIPQCPMYFAYSVR